MTFFLNLVHSQKIRNSLFILILTISWEFHFQEVSSDLKSIAEMLSKLRYELMTNKPLIPFEVDAPDQEIWNKALEEEAVREGKDPTWFDSPWLLVECYMYRRIREAFDTR